MFPYYQYVYLELPQTKNMVSSEECYNHLFAHSAADFPLNDLRLYHVTKVFD